VNLHAFPVLLSALLAAQSPDVANFDFTAGTLAGWDGEGFTLEVANGKDPKEAYSVTSKERDALGGKALLHRAFIVPADAGVIRFRACAIRDKSCPANENLDVLLLGAGKRILPKRVRLENGWKEAGLLPAQDGQPREYIWPVAAHAGKWLRIVVLDEDARAGCYLQCGGFQVQTQEEFEAAEFGADLQGVASRYKLPTLVPYESEHFLAMSNAEEGFSNSRLKLCETQYRLFYDHFRRKNLTLYSPRSRLQVSMFDSQAGFEAYLGRKMSADIIGIYQPASNRLVMYDFARNDAFVARKQEALRKSQKIFLQMDRLQYLDDLDRRAREARADANTATIMHEVAHQLSFNCGMLNRQADVPSWLAEGLACYCEATANGSWQGIGEIDPPRVWSLAETIRAKQKLMSLKELLETDHWARTTDVKLALLGYAQSWALFRMLIEEQPHRLGAYLKLIYSERVAERRLANFQQAFGSDLTGLEARYTAYVKNIVEQHAPRKR